MKQKLISPEDLAHLDDLKKAMELLKEQGIVPDESDMNKLVYGTENAPAETEPTTTTYKTLYKRNGRNKIPARKLNKIKKK